MRFYLVGAIKKTCRMRILFLNRSLVVLIIDRLKNFVNQTREAIVLQPVRIL